MTTAQTQIAPIAAEDFAGAPIGFAEFVALIAALMALGALGIDSMLPALPAIGTSLGIASGNARQWVITAFVIGFGIAQLAHGPLADRYGRRTVLIWSLAGYAVANIACALAGSFVLLLAARAIGGAAVAATRVATVALVRDCYHGRAMAKVMSIAFMVFMVVPVLAPTFGQVVLLFGDWRMIFWVVAGITLAVLTWFMLRMPETLAVEDQQPISASRILSGWRTTLTNRWSLGYTLATTALMSALYGYINSIQQIMFDTFRMPAMLVFVFAGTAATMAAANLLNSRIVMRVGTRRISHSAMTALATLAALHLALVLGGYENIYVFAVLQALSMACFGLSTSNFSAMAMEDMGHIAGTASSVQGFLSVTIGAVFGALIGQAFDGTTAPMVGGFLMAALTALVFVTITERGRLFRSH